MEALALADRDDFAGQLRRPCNRLAVVEGDCLSHALRQRRRRLELAAQERHLDARLAINH